MKPDLLPELLVASSLILLVAEGVPTVRITNGNGTRLVAAVGKPVELECVVSGLNGVEKVQLRWRYVSDFSVNPIILNSTDDYTITEVTQSRNIRVIRLRTAAVAYAYEGYYYCHLLTAEKDYTDYVEVRVEGQPTFDLNQTTPPGELASSLQGFMEIVCTVKARPGAGIKWFLNDTQLYSSATGYTIATTEPLLGIATISSLSVFPLTQEQLGTYTCEAKNARGQARMQWWVTAVPRLTVVTPDRNRSRVDLGEALNIQCEGVNLGDAGKITWSFSSNGVTWTALTGDNIVAWTDASGAINSQFSVANSHYFHQGVYRCSWYKMYRSVVIRVIGPPIVTLSTTTVTALPGDDVTMTCRVNANPRPTTLGWFYKNQELRNSTKYTVYRTYLAADLYSQTTLTIYPIEETDYGSKYSCVARNAEGHDTVDVTLEDVNECETGTATCQFDQHEICVDTLGSYECHCATGFDRTGGTCTVITADLLDVNQCKVGHQCDQTCVNYFGSFRCECMADFILQADMVTCIPVSSFMESSTQPPAVANVGGMNTVAVGLGVGITVVIVVIVIVIVVIVCRRRGNRERELIDIPKPKPSPTSGFYNTAYSVDDDEAHIYSELSPTGDEFPRGRLRFLNSLGEGKFGRVVMAEALSINKTGKWEEVAVKMVKEAATDAVKEDFYHELTIVRKLPTHPNVVAYLGCVTASDPALMIMEYINGGDLLTYLRKHRPGNTTEQTSKEETLTPKHMLSFALQVARGMAHIAAQKIIHRDVAARNILIDRKNVCKVSDFGLARDVEGADIYETTNKGPLPIRWMAPESLRDSIHTSKSDVWSFGVLLWEIVTLGSSPYPGLSGQQVMTSVLEGKKLVCPPQCNKDLYGIMSRCWSDPATSRPTFDILSRDFERILEDEGDYIQLNQMEEGIYHVLEGTRTEERF